MTQPIDDTLAERGARYGSFEGHAQITQSIKAAMFDSDNWDALDDDIKECLEMVAHKIGRIINGDPQYIDSWTDIIGYARLVEKRLIDEQTPPIDQPNAVESILDVLKRIKAEADAKNAEPCDNPECYTCHPDTAAALDTLIKAGAIRRTD
jgi:hypothetical protein